MHTTWQAIPMLVATTIGKAIQSEIRQDGAGPEDQVFFRRRSKSTGTLRRRRQMPEGMASIAASSAKLLNGRQHWIST